jgi:transcriptional regulator with XRE-family HTH domain
MSDKSTIDSPGLKHLYDKFVADDPVMLEHYEAAGTAADIAQKVYDLRKQAGYSQRELAAIVGTTASVICRLEDADYDGHSLNMLRRIGEALGYGVRVVFVARGQSAPPVTAASAASIERVPTSGPAMRPASRHTRPKAAPKNVSKSGGKKAGVGKGVRNAAKKAR